MKKIFQLLTLLILFPSISFGDSTTIPASEIKVLTEKCVADKAAFEFAEGYYEYEVSWAGIPAASAGLSIEKEPDAYRSIASAKTASAIDLLYKLRCRAESTVDDTFHPVKTVIQQTENRKVKSTEISFAHDGEINSVRTTKGKPSEIEKFNPNNFTLDPLSTALLARSLEWSQGMSRTFDTYNGKTRYLITLTCASSKVMKVNGVDKKVWVIVPTVRNLNDETKNKKLRHAEMYVTADKNRELLQINSEVFIGTVSIKLKTFTPKVAPVQMASLPRVEWNF